MTGAPVVFDEYDELGKAYADPGHLMYKKMRLVTDAVTGGKALLDFGCGQGELLSRVADRFGRVTGVDVTEKSIEMTRARLAGMPGASVYVYDGAMPEMEGGFDWVTCLDVLEHVEDPPKVLGEILKLMSPGGRILVTVPNWYDIINAKLLGRNKYHLHAHTPWGWTGMLKKTGFIIDGVRSVSFPVIKSEFLARRLYAFGMCIFILGRKPG